MQLMELTRKTIYDVFPVNQKLDYIFRVTIEPNLFVNLSENKAY